MELVIGLSFVFVPPLVAIVLPALFALRTLVRRGPVAIKSRLAIIVMALFALVSLIAAHELVAWDTMIPSLFWLLPIALFAAGVGGAVEAWGRLPFTREGRRPAVAITGAAVGAAVAGAVAILVLG